MPTDIPTFPAGPFSGKMSHPTCHIALHANTVSMQQLSGAAQESKPSARMPKCTYVFACARASEHTSMSCRKSAGARKRQRERARDRERERVGDEKSRVRETGIDMYVYMYIHVCICVYMNTCMWLCTYSVTHTYIYMKGYLLHAYLHCRVFVH